jgi:hypothetical protein
MNDSGSAAAHCKPVDRDEIDGAETGWLASQGGQTGLAVMMCLCLGKLKTSEASDLKIARFIGLWGRLEAAPSAQPILPSRPANPQPISFLLFRSP